MVDALPTGRARSAARADTVAYLGVFVLLGLGMSWLGPALTHLRVLTGASASAAGGLFVAQSLGYLVGSGVGGRVVDRGHGHAGLAGAMVALSISFALLIPSSSFLAVVVVLAVLGLAGGVTDVAGNTLLTWVPHHAPASAMNGLHFCFGVGALLSPLLVARSLGADDSLTVFAVVAGAGALVMVPVVLARPTPPRPAPAPRATPERRGPDRRVLIVASFFLIYVGVEAGFAGWLASYSDSVGLGGSHTGQWLTSAFWGAFTAARLGAAVIARHLSRAAILFGGGLAALASTVVMAVGNGNALTTWAGAVGFAVAVAPQFPTMISYADEHIGLAGADTGVFIAASSIGGIILPWLIGQGFDAIGAKALPIVGIASSMMLLGSFAAVTRALQGAGAMSRPASGAPPWSPRPGGR